MRSKIAVLFCILVGFGVAFTRMPGPEAVSSVHSHKTPDLIVDCGGTFGFCGFRERASRKLYIPLHFEAVAPFSEGLSAVRVRGLYGYIDLSGRMVIEPRFERAGDFFLGRAEVVSAGKSGIIDRHGRFVVQPQFARSIVWTKEVALVRYDAAQTETSGGRQRLDTLRDNPSALSSLGWGLFHFERGWLTKPEFRFVRFDDVGRGFIWASSRDSSPDRYGLLRADGTWQAVPQYTSVQPLSDGRATVGLSVSAGETDNTLFGAVDADGQLVVPIKHRQLSSWANGFAIVGDGERVGLLDKSGSLVRGRLFERAERREFGGNARVMIDGGWYVLDQHGTISDENYLHGPVIASCPSGIRLVELNSGKQVVGPDNLPTISRALQYVSDFRFSCDQPNPVKLFEPTTNYLAWTFLGQDGRLLVEPVEFDSVMEFSKGHAIVKLNGKWGIIDSNGKYSVKPEFDGIVPYGTQISMNGNGSINILSNDYVPDPAAPQLYTATKNGIKKVIDARGQQAARPPSSDRRSKYLKCPGGETFFRQFGLWGQKDRFGRVLIEPRYLALHCVGDNIWGAIGQKRQFCPIDPNGHVRSEFKCRDGTDQFWTTAPVTMYGRSFLSNVLWWRDYLNYGAGWSSAPPRLWVRRGELSGFTGETEPAEPSHW